MSGSTTDKTVIKMFALVTFFILLFGGAAIYAAFQAKDLKKELETTQEALVKCQNGVE